MEQRKVSKEFVSANILNVEVTHNGNHGGDAGHGGFVNIKFEDYASTAYGVTVIGGDIVGVDNGLSIDQPKSITLSFMGDCERDTLIESLEFIIKELKENETVNESFVHHEEM